MIRNWHTNVFGVEDPTVGTFEAFLISPVPSSTSEISRLGVVRVRENTFSFFQVISIEAFSAVSVLSMSLTLVRNWHADVFGVENPIFRADQAFLVVPIPSSASDISRLSVVEIREDAFAFLKVVSLEAFSAVSIFSMNLALIRNWHADMFRVEDPIFGAGQAFLVVPIPGSASNI